MTNEELLDEMLQAHADPEADDSASSIYHNRRAEILSRMGQPAGTPPQVEPLYSCVQPKLIKRKVATNDHS